MELQTKAEVTIWQEPSPLKVNWHRFSKNPLTLIGSSVLLIFVFLAIFAPILIRSQLDN